MTTRLALIGRLPIAARPAIATSDPADTVSEDRAMLNPTPILLYHRVDNSGRRFATDPAVFASHLSWLADHGYRSLTTEELTGLVSGSTGSPPAKPFMITFDDGFADLGTTVAPILRDHGFTATAFMITSQCPVDSSTGSEYLAWSEARALASEGVFEFHSHTHSHVRRVPDSADTAAVRDDIDSSLTVLSDELGRPRSEFTHLAWPFARTCTAWEEAALDLGVTTQFVVQRGAVTNADQHLRLPRLMVDGYSLNAVKAWMTVLSTRGGAFVGNQLFGRVRDVRRGAGYR